ncbi:hypothetical protein [Marivita sp.]|uniref:hypothetical protein n=1 Tax=Marivita sp. TaxID=2003365 RepID=UPI003F72D451
MTELSDAELKQLLWKHLPPLFRDFGIFDAPERFPGQEEFDHILGSNIVPILEALAG